MCEGAIHSIGKIWFNNRLVYDGASTDPETIQASNEFLANNLTIYLGTLTQNPDPYIESFEGVGNVPGFRERVYLVFRGIDLTPYGNAVPRPDVEVFQKEPPNNVSLREVIQGLLDKSGLQPNQYDLSDGYLNGEILGFTFNQSGNALRSAIEDLQKVVQFIVVDTGDKLVFRAINPTTITTIDKYALAAISPGNAPQPRAIEVQEQEEDLPSEIQLEYDNVGNNYNRGVQTQYKSKAIHINELNFKTKVSLVDSLAQTSVTRLLEYYWTQTRQFEGIRLNTDYYNLNAGDVINLEIRGQSVNVQVERLNKSPDLLVEVFGFSYDETIPLIDAPSDLDGEYNVNEINKIPAFGNPTAIAVDTNLVRDGDSNVGLYATGVPEATSTWVVGSLYGALAGGEFSFISSLGSTAAHGTTSTVIPDGEPFIIDTVTVFQVVLDFGILESVPDDSFYNLSQMIYINGELIAFQNASLVSGSTYDVSNLIRGVRGTESSISSHAISSDIRLVRGNNSFDNCNADSNAIAQNVEVKAVPAGANQTQVTNTTALNPFNNFRSYPYSPIDFVLSKDSSTDDLILEWTRRTRRGGSWTAGAGVIPLSEDFELYDIEIYNGAILVRTISNNPTNSYTYTSSQQIVDFGAVQGSIDARIYQLSSLTGRGYQLDTGLVGYSEIT